MKNIFLIAAASSALLLSAEVGFADGLESVFGVEKQATPSEKAPCVLVLVEDSSVENLLKNIEKPVIVDIVSSRLSELGVKTCSTDFLEGVAAGNLFKSLSPAETIFALGADYVLTVRFSKPIEHQSEHDAMALVKQPVTYSLLDSTGRRVDADRASKIFSAASVSSAQREQLILNAAEAAAEKLGEKISAGKVSLKSQRADLVSTEAEFVCVLEPLTFPQLVENDDGTLSAEFVRGNATLDGVSMRIGGIDYRVNADGTPTKISVPMNRPLFVSLSHRDIAPVNRIIKVANIGERVVLDVLLSDAVKKRWQKDLFEITEALKASARRDKMAEAELAERQKESERRDKILDAEIAERQKASARRDKITDAEIAHRDKMADAEIAERQKESARRDILTGAEADLIRGKVKFWENSGFHFSQNVSRKILHEEKTETTETTGTTPAHEVETAPAEEVKAEAAVPAETTAE